MTDLPTILDRIRHEPDHEPNWLALASHFEDNGHYDVAVVVRHHWPAFREELRNGGTVEDATIVQHAGRGADREAGAGIGGAGIPVTLGLAVTAHARAIEDR